MSKNWDISPLKDICTVFTDGNWIESKHQSEEGIRLIQTGNIGFGYYKDKSDKSRYISEETFLKLKCTEILPGDLLVSRLPDPVGKSCIIPNINSKMITGVDCTIIRLKDILISEYLLYYQMSFQYLKDVESKVSGTTRSRISRKNLGLISIPYPKKEIQKQIVEILDTAFEAIEKAKTNLEKNLKNTKELFDSKLNEIFSQKGEDWEEKTLGEVCNIVGGGTPSKSNEDYYYHGDILWATVRDMKVDIINNTELKITNLGLTKSSANLIPLGHVIISTRVGLGKVCLLKHDTAINQDLKGIIPIKENNILNKFIYWWFKSISQKIIDEGTGATVQGVKLPFIKSLIFPIISIERQNEIIKLIDNLSNKTKQLEQKYQQKLNNLEELKKSLLQKAFSGELTN